MQLQSLILLLLACPLAAARTELVYNGSFEKGLSGWEGWLTDGTASIENRDTDAGNFAAKLAPGYPLFQPLPNRPMRQGDLVSFAAKLSNDTVLLLQILITTPTDNQSFAYFWYSTYAISAISGNILDLENDSYDAYYLLTAPTGKWTQFTRNLPTDYAAAQLTTIGTYAAIRVILVTTAAAPTTALLDEVSLTQTGGTGN
jgi:hypothetical protein